MYPDHGIGEAQADRNTDDTLREAAARQPVPAAILTAFGGRAAVTRLLAGGYLEQHPAKAGHLVITPKGRRYLASL